MRRHFLVVGVFALLLSASIAVSARVGQADPGQDHWTMRDGGALLPELQLVVPRGSTVTVTLTRPAADADVTVRLMAHGQALNEDPGVEMHREPGSRDVRFRLRRRTRAGEHIVVDAVWRHDRQRVTIEVQ